VRVYLDTSVYNRPFDDQTQPRIWLETLAFFVVLQMIEERQVELVTSSVLAYENSQNPFLLRKRWVNRCLAIAGHSQMASDAIKARAQQLEEAGLKAIDALHVACAESAGSEYFLTCDDEAVNRYEGRMHVVNPLDFVVSLFGEQL